jgi:hypothetical protein
MRSAWMCLCPSATKSTSTAPTKGGVARIEFSRKRSWSHTLAQARGDSHAAVSQNSTTCASVRAQVRPKSPRLTTASKRVFCHPILQLVRLQSETSVLCVCCVSVDGCMVDGARFTILLAGLEVEGDGSSPSAMPLPRKEYPTIRFSSWFDSNRRSSVVRVLRVCGWLHGRRRPVHATPGRARGRRRWKLAECDAKERRRSNCPALLCLFGVIAFASKLVGVWMSTLDESQPPGAARHASISCSLWELNYMRKRERERERDERERSCAAIERSMDRTNKLRLSVICHRGGNNQPSLLCSHFLRGDSLASFRPKQHHSTTRTSGGSKQFCPFSVFSHCWFVD